jgi:hypothetical protein
MTNGKYSRSFGAGTAGKWTFKVVWIGDNEYTNSESNNITVNVSNALAVTVTANPSTIYSGGTSTIRATVTSGGAPVTGATLSPTSSSVGAFSAVTDQGNGTYVATYTAPDLVTRLVSTISVPASKPGYIGASGQAQVSVEPLVITINVKGDDGSTITSVSVASSSQPSGQAALSGNTDANGKVTFNGVLKGAYSFKASKSGYEDKTWTLNVQAGQAMTETTTLVKQSGIPGYPPLSIALALLLSLIILFKRTLTNARKPV